MLDGLCSVVLFIWGHLRPSAERVFSDIFLMKSPRNFSLSHQPPLRGTDWNVDRQARLSTIYSTYCRLSKSQLFFDIYRNFGFALSPPIRSYKLYKAISLTWISSRSFAAFPPIGNFPWKKNIKVQRSLMT